MIDHSIHQLQHISDLLDAAADIYAELEEAMRESSQDEWDGVEEISSAERNACDHYNERYVINDSRN